MQQTDLYCKWCNKFNGGHSSKDCPYATPLKKIMKMEKIIVKRRAKSNFKYRFRGRFRKFRRRFKK